MKTLLKSDNFKLVSLNTNLSPRQYELMKLHLKAYGKVCIWTRKGKSRILNADEITIFESKM